MKIKDRIALYFTLFSGLILMLVLFIINITFHKFLETDFFNRLQDRTMVTAKLYLEADEISLDSLNKVRNKYFEKIPGEIIRIYNSKNTATFIGEAGNNWDNKIIEQVRRKKKIYIKEENDKQTVGIYYQDNQGDFVIFASAEDLGTSRRMAKLTESMIVIFIIFSILIWLIGRKIAKQSLAPIDNLITEIKEIKSNNLHFRLHEGNGKDEISLLAKNFNALLLHLENSFELQKNFIANASHELKTPLTSIIMGVDVTLTHERQVKEYQETLLSIKEDADKLRTIISVLLNLAQEDIEFASATTEDIHLNSLIANLKEEWDEQLYPNALIIEKPLSLDFYISANASLMHIALNNIIGNAFKFSNHKNVSCNIYKKAENIIIDIKDQGIGISQADKQNIFKPFYRSANVSNFSGNGLGLYMAKKIIDLYEGDIIFSSSNAYATIISIVLKSKS